MKKTINIKRFLFIKKSLAKTVVISALASFIAMPVFSQSLVIPKRVETYIGGNFLYDLDNRQDSFGVAEASGSFQKKNVNKGSSIMLRWGYREDSTYALEFGYMNAFKVSARSDRNYQVEHSAQGLIADLFLFFPINPQLSVYGKIGTGYVNITSISLIPGKVQTTEKTSRWMPTVGVGVEYLITPAFAVRAGWESYKIRTSESGTFSRSGLNIGGLMFYE